MGSNKSGKYTFKKLGKSNIDYLKILAQESNKKITEAVVEATGRTETKRGRGKRRGGIKFQCWEGVPERENRAPIVNL